MKKLRSLINLESETETEREFMTAYSEATHTLLNKLTSIKHRHNTQITQVIS